MKQMNRLKAVLAEQHRTGKWLAEAVGRNEATVSWWCTNSCQPPMEMMYKIAKLLDVDVKNLLLSSKTDGYEK
jgi:DNA-binding XRE family transcriptional regulator